METHPRSVRMPPVKCILLSWAFPRPSGTMPRHAEGAGAGLQAPLRCRSGGRRVCRAPGPYCRARTEPAVTPSTSGPHTPRGPVLLERSPAATTSSTRGSSAIQRSRPAMPEESDPSHRCSIGGCKRRHTYRGLIPEPSCPDGTFHQRSPCDALPCSRGLVEGVAARSTNGETTSTLPLGQTQPVNAGRPVLLDRLARFAGHTRPSAAELSTDGELSGVRPVRRDLGAR